MTAIATKVLAKPIECEDIIVLRNETAQASTGQTDWIDVPHGARFAQVCFNLTSVGASTTPTFLPALQYADPIARNDTYSMTLGEHAAFTALTAAGMLVVDIGPGVTGIANDVTNSATVKSWASLNVVLPWLMGFTVTNDRGSGDEVYSYTISVVFRK